MMRCPKCGYNSFDHLDSCKKCSKDLVEFKQGFGIKSVLFPGQMKPGGSAATEFDTTVADAAVIAATGAATTAAGTGADESVAASSDGDDFGFDFMGDSAEDDDLSFDELFEDAPEDDDIEETIEAPKEPVASPSVAPIDEAALEDDFGFDADASENDSAKDEFSFDDVAETDSEPDGSGIGEDPKRPFDLPESPAIVGAPEAGLNHIAGQTSFFTEGGKPVQLVAEVESPVPADLPESYIFEPESLPATTAKPVAVSAPHHSQTTVGIVTAVEPLEEERVAVAAEVQLPSLGSSIGAFICDLLVLSVVGISFVVAAEAAMATEKTSLLPSLHTLVDLSVPYFLVLFFLAFGYFTLFHFLTGQTPGKMLTRLRVETVSGEPLIFSQAFLRSAGGLLQLLPVGLGYLSLLTSLERRGWNDRLAGTRVVALRNSP